LTDKPCHENLQGVLENGECVEPFNSYVNFKKAVREGKYGATAQLWISYMDMIWLILDCIRATKENNLDLHVSTLYGICSWFFAYDHMKYARYTTVYLITLLNLYETHPGAKQLLQRMDSAFLDQTSQIQGIWLTSQSSRQLIDMLNRTVES
jgi:hypothetical protein